MLLQVVPPDTPQRVAEAIYAALIFGAAFAVLWHLTAVDEDGGMPRWQRWRAWIGAWLASGVSLRRYLAGEPDVNNFEDEDEPKEEQEALPVQHITSSGEQTEQTAQTDRQTDHVSVGDQWLTRLKVDRTKGALIELLVYSGWGVGEIRSAIKGDSTAIGLEIQALRGGGVEVVSEVDPDVHVTPIAGRVTQKRYYPDEPELEFRAP